METDRDASALKAAADFLRRFWLQAVAISAGLLIPCFWHRRIEAGDLGSHVYNAWLAQLIERGQAPGLYLARQWNNVLFDLLLLKLGNLFGLAAAQKILVPLCVLIFFWGAFALIAAVSQRPPWFLLLCLAMLAYGWTFNVGFFNYYLSLGLGFFATAIVWGGRGRELILAAVLAALALIAHPQGFVWLVGCVGYVVLSRLLPGWWKLAVPGAAVLAVVVARFYLMRHYESFGIWDTFGPGIYNGSDQVALYCTRYYVLSCVALLFGMMCFVADRLQRQGARESWAAMRLPLELHWLVVLAIYVLPDVVRVPLYSGWVGALALRLTTVAAVMGLCVLALVQARKWRTAGFATIAIVFFAFLYRDTATLNRMEAQIERLIESSVPVGGRVAATIWASPDSRIPYIVHLVDRACVGKCFSFQNYEPPSRQFRVRVEEGGSPLNTDDSDTSQQLEAGEYVVQPEDLPMAQIYQCDESDLTRLCVRQLTVGELNGRIGYHPPRE
ncbi:MAG TPA: hypothetical protein VN943_16530 [Candidatus Acidoferrum sp.]|nr:hypothetical protein [Candidatus Acidoferrum sp.]